MLVLKNRKFGRKYNLISRQRALVRPDLCLLLYRIQKLDFNGVEACRSSEITASPRCEEIADGNL